MANHELKTWPEFFASVVDGEKPFEVRLDDRGFRAGDTLLLREWIPTDMVYTGRQHKTVVSYILAGPAFGIASGYVVMGLEPPKIAELRAKLAELEQAARFAVLALAHAKENSPGLYDEAYSKISAALAEQEVKGE